MAEQIAFTAEDLFVAFRMPKASGYQIMKDDDLLGDYEFVIHPFDKEGSTPSVSIKSNTFLVNQPFSFEVKTTCNVPSTNKSDYLNLANTLINEMQTPALEKVVLSRIHHVPAKDVNLSELFIALTIQYPNAFIYCYNIPAQGAWIGATPEILMERNNDIITTVALASTQKVNGRSTDEVIWNDKEIEEQAIIQRYIETHLNDAKLEYTKGNTYTSKAGNVFHIKTVYEVPNMQSTDELINQLHPGPAICGMPKPTAKQRIINGEAHDRAFYCGYLGLKTKDKTSLFINLRCMQVFSDQFALYVGGGLTKDSIAEKEWEETTTKSKTLESVIQKAYIYAHDVE